MSEPLNREQRREQLRQMRRDPDRLRALRAAGEAGQRDADAMRPVRMYCHDGTVAMTWYLRGDEKPPQQVRTVRVPKTYDGPPIRGVSDAERLGRIDLIQCFWWNDAEQCYRELEGGHDRLPGVNDPKSCWEQARNFEGYEDVRDQMDELIALFPEGEIFPGEAAMLAFFLCRIPRRMVDAVQLDPDSDEVLDEHDAFSQAFWGFVEKVGLLKDLGIERCRRYVGRMPPLRKRWLELRDAQHGTVEP